MMKAIVLCIFLFPARAFAQFPAPVSFQIGVNYVLEGLWDLCDGQVLEGPAYCNYFYWQAPNTANTPATLTGYRIYKDDEFFLPTTNTSADTAGAYIGSFCVTALYENPAGESDSSNVVVISDLPMATEEIDVDKRIHIRFNQSQQALIIQGAQYARALWVYNMQGAQVLFTDAVSTYLRLEGLAPGIYLVVVQDKYSGVSSTIVALGF